MVDEQKENARQTKGNESGKNSSSASSSKEAESGDPGRTPGSAEGDEATIDEDLRDKEREGKL
jgi:hypothetical protein